MELYYKDLISEDASLERLVDELNLIVQGADEFVAAAGAELEASHKAEIVSRLQKLKAGCRRLQQQTLAGARATDKLLRAYPYSSVGLGFAVGLLVGAVLRRRR